MGRAFIVPEYQKRPLALGFIWECIGQFMAYAAGNIRI